MATEYQSQDWSALTLTKTILSSPNQTLEFARKLATTLSSGDIVTLEGDLAAGKTTFTKGLALGLGITDTVDSPTFAIIKEYHGKINLYHMDVYRLDGDSDVEFILEYLDKEGVIVIEWASIIEADLPKNRLDIKLTRLTGDQREITIVDNR